MKIYATPPTTAASIFRTPAPGEPMAALTQKFNSLIQPISHVAPNEYTETNALGAFIAKYDEVHEHELMEMSKEDAHALSDQERADRTAFMCAGYLRA